MSLRWCVRSLIGVAYRCRSTFIELNIGCIAAWCVFHNFSTRVSICKNDIARATKQNARHRMLLLLLFCLLLFYFNLSFPFSLPESLCFVQMHHRCHHCCCCLINFIYGPCFHGNVCYHCNCSANKSE